MKDREEETTMSTKKDDLYMAGTEGTGEYKVVAQTFFGGRVGVRDLGNEICRVRVEPRSEASAKRMKDSGLFSVDDWKQPGDGGEFRFSTITSDSKELDEAIRLGCQAIVIGPGIKGVQVDPGASDKKIEAGVKLDCHALSIDFGAEAGSGMLERIRAIFRRPGNQTA